MQRVVKTISKIILLILVLVLVIAAPLCLMFIIGLDAPPILQPVSGGTLKEQSWIAFSGAYMGAIIGAVGAVTIMFITIKENRKEKQESRRYEDFLYVRDKLEKYAIAVEGWNPEAVITQMLSYCNSDQIRKWVDWGEMHRRFIETIRVEYGGVRRALSQAINNIPEERSRSIELKYYELEDWEEKFSEFINKVNRHLQAIDPIQGNPKAENLDKLYSALVEDVKQGNYSWAEQTAENNPYSFFFLFTDVKTFENGETMRLGAFYMKTRFVEVYRETLLSYQVSYERIAMEIKVNIERLLVDLQRQQKV